VALAALLAGCAAPQAAPTTPDAVPAPPASASAAPATIGAVGRSAAPGPSAPAASGVVPAAELRRLSVPAAGFDEAVSPLSVAAMGNAIDPPLARAGRPSLPVRVADRGVRPGGDAADTVYVGCHTSARFGTASYPCNALVRDVGAGDQIVATTDAGTLTYVVTKTRSIPKDAFAGDEETWRVQPRRLVLVMCDIVDGRGNGANWVIFADLDAAR